MDEGALTLAQDLLVAETESFYFGSVSDIAVASDGRMFVFDSQATHVKVLRPDGTLIDSVGREGKGPGELERAGQIALARGDSLYVLERGSREISVFAPAGHFVRAVPFTTGGAAPRALMVPSDAPGFLLSHTVFFSETSDITPLVVRLLDPSSEEADTLFVAEGLDIYRPKDWIYHPVPFSPRPRLELGPEGRVHYAWGDSLSVTTYRLNGVRETTVSIPFQSVPVSEEERAEVVEQGPSIPASEIPSTKPAFEDFLVDDEGRYWFRRQTAHVDSTDWWVADPDAKRVATTRMADDVSILTVRNEAAYGRTTTNNGAPALVQYRIRNPSN